MHRLRIYDRKVLFCLKLCTTIIFISYIFDLQKFFFDRILIKDIRILQVFTIYLYKNTIRYK